MRPPDINLVPADVRHFEIPIRKVEALARALDQTQAIPVIFLGVFEDNLGAQTDPQNWRPSGEGRMQRVTQS